MDRIDIRSFLSGAAELGSVALFVTMVLIWADAIGVS